MLFFADCASGVHVDPVPTGAVDENTVPLSWACCLALRYGVRSCGILLRFDFLHAAIGFEAVDIQHDRQLLGSLAMRSAG